MVEDDESATRASSTSSRLGEPAADTAVAGLALLGGLARAASEQGEWGEFLYVLPVTAVYSASAATGFLWAARCRELRGDFETFEGQMPDHD